MFGPALTAAEAAVFDAFVVPRYLSFFGSSALNLLLSHSPASIAHLVCRTGYPDAALAERLPNSSLVGVDPSPAALDLARTKATLIPQLTTAYQAGESLPTSLPAQSFTHAIALHPICGSKERAQLLAELHRLLVPGGQALVALPLRGSFPEVADMIREFALRQDLAELGMAVDAAAANRPTIETVAEEFENAGLTEVDVDVQLIAISFDGGREFLEDPIARLMVFPETRALLPVDSAVLESSLQYVHTAISKYWSEGPFELTVNVGCASGRRLG